MTGRRIRPAAQIFYACLICGIVTEQMLRIVPGFFDKRRVKDIEKKASMLSLQAVARSTKL
jgi:hypothetical protein